MSALSDPNPFGQPDAGYYFPLCVCFKVWKSFSEQRRKSPTAEVLQKVRKYGHHYLKALSETCIIPTADVVLMFFAV